MNKRKKQLEIREPESFALDLLIGKNQWLIKIRWLYTFFILLFFTCYNYISSKEQISLRNLMLIVGLSLLGNVIFIVALKRNVKNVKESLDVNSFLSIASLQLDFDLVLLSLLSFFTGGFDSPVIVLFIFYIMISTFLVSHKAAFKDTLNAMVLVLVISFAREESMLSLERFATMIAFLALLFFSYLISAYLSRNLKESEDKLQALLKHTKELSVSDGLTNLYNQAHFFFLLNLQLDKAKRYESPFSIVVFDVDNFKSYNDNNGHIIGSEALRKISRIMKRVFRNSDILARYGGDEFVIILTNSDKVGAFLAADRLREVVESEVFEGEETQPLGKMTLSLGIASYPLHGITSNEILDRADKALYWAKKSGRNKAIIYSEEFDQPPGMA